MMQMSPRKPSTNRKRTFSESLISSILTGMWAFFRKNVAWHMLPGTARSV